MNLSYNADERSNLGEQEVKSNFTAIVKQLLYDIYFSHTNVYESHAKMVNLIIERETVTYEMEFYSFRDIYADDEQFWFYPTHRFKALTFPDILSDYKADKFVVKLGYDERRKRDLNFALKILGQLRPTVNLVELNDCKIYSCKKSHHFTLNTIYQSINFKQFCICLENGFQSLE